MSLRGTGCRGVSPYSASNASFYDGIMTYFAPLGKAICRIVWNLDGEKNLRYLEKALSGVPADFSGKLLEVPVGTGVLTMPDYRETYRVLKKGGTFCGCFCCRK